MEEIAERWATSDGVRLHYLIGNVSEAAHAPASLTPLAFVPGGLGAAEDYVPDMATFAPRLCLAMSLRGQGRSDAPAGGYTLPDYAGDVAATLADSGVERPCLMAYSLAVPIAVAYAARHPQRISGLILGDYPPVYPDLSPEWVDSAVLTLGRLSQRHVMEAMQAESQEIELWERLPQIACPALVMRGDRPGAKLGPEDAERYRRALPDVRIVVFPHSGHALWEPDDARFFQVMQTFLAELDGRET
jgi:pimeloyl-ACP methyl ester carboxylesterase